MSEALIFSHSKRTRDLFALHVLDPLALDERSHRIKLEAKMHHEYSMVRDMAPPVVNKDAAKQKKQQQQAASAKPLLLTQGGETAATTAAILDEHEQQRASNSAKPSEALGMVPYAAQNDPRQMSVALRAKMTVKRVCRHGCGCVDLGWFGLVLVLVWLFCGLLVLLEGTY